MRWNSKLSAWFAVESGVLQAGVRSPSMVNVFVNLFIVNIVRSGFGSHLNNLSMACLMYADDLVLFSASVYDLQRLLDICSSTADSLSLKCNCQKSSCLTLGHRYNDVIEPMTIGIGVNDWCSNVKYLGGLIKSARHLVTDIDVTVRKFIYRLMPCLVFVSVQTS